MATTRPERSRPMPAGGPEMNRNLRCAAMRDRGLRALTLTTLAAGLALSAGAQGAPGSAGLPPLYETPRVYQGAEATARTNATLTPAALSVSSAPPEWRPGDPIKEIPKLGRGRPSKIDPAAQAAARAKLPPGDPLLDKQAGAASATTRAFGTTLLNFAGQGFTGVNPPDTVGDVGPNHYVQGVNSSAGSVIRVFNKAGGTLSTFTLDTLGSGNCAIGAGDPIVVYDQLANRWLLSEFSDAGNQLCVYISTGPNPLGTYHNYAFTAPSFPDYPKYAVWPDAYYVSSNEESSAVYALDRAKMLTGAAATMQRFTAPDLGAFSFQALLPADSDGATAPPAGAPGIFMRHNDDEAHSPTSAVSGADFLEIWEFDVNWTAPVNSTFTNTLAIPIAEIDSELCGYTAFLCFPQLGSGTTLDPLREVIMFRLAHRNFGTHETLLGNLVTDVNGADRGGIRWFELRRATPGAGAWTLYQEGTYAPPDGQSRWMGSIAMDGAGNIALGYSASGPDNYPSIRYTGRTPADLGGTLPQGETIIQAGTGANNSNRWGDYSAMSVDPADDCTFWHTNMYSLASTNWATRIASMRFDDCGPGFLIAPEFSRLELCAADGGIEAQVSVASVMGYSNPVALSLTSPTPFITGAFSPVSVTPGNAATLALTLAPDTPAGTYELTIAGTGTGADDRAAALEIVVPVVNPETPMLFEPADGLLVPSLSPQFSWEEVPFANAYDFQLALDPGFTSLVADTTVGAASFTAQALEPETDYYWRVRARTACGVGAYANASTFTTGSLICATGPITIPDSEFAVPGTVDIDIVTGEGGVIDDLNIGLVVNHTWVGDLEFSLRHVDTGTTVSLIDRPGYISSGFGCSEDNIDVVLDDDSTTPVETTCGGLPALSGVLKPQMPLAAFNGEALAGTWRLTASDHAPGDEGAVLEWCLLPVIATTADSDGDGVGDDVDNCTNRHNPAQIDTNGDNIGNACDPDVSGATGEDCVVNFFDLSFFRANFALGNPVIDISGPAGLPDGLVNFFDISRLREMFFGPPGPSAAGCN